MHTALDYLQAFGLGLAVGVRPFLAVLVAGALATANAGVDFDGTAFAFLEQPWWLVAMAAALLLSFLAPRAPGVAALAGRPGRALDRPRRRPGRRDPRRPI